MMSYTNLEQSQKKRKIGKIVIMSVLLISIIIIGVFSYINNNDNKSFRRKIDVMEGDISNLYNYTETMSDFIVGNYKLPEVISQPPPDPPSIQFKLLLEKIEEVKNRTLKVQMDLKEELNDFKEQSIKVQMDLRKLTIRNLAIEFLKNNFGFKPNFWYGIVDCDNKFKNVNFNDYYENFLKIDYDNFVVSFAYFNDDYVENIKANPLYILVNKSLEYDYKLLSNRPYSLSENIYYIDDSRHQYSYYNALTFKDKYPYKEHCGMRSVEYDYSYYFGRDILTKIYDEYEYMNKIVWVKTISPQKFL